MFVKSSESSQTFDNGTSVADPALFVPDPENDLAETVFETVLPNEKVKLIHK